MASSGAVRPQRKTPAYTRPLESATRKKIDLMLSNLGWRVDEDAPDCNVFTERAKTTAQEAKFKGKRPDYLLYQSDTDNPIAVIEAKRKGEDLRDAIDRAIEKYARPLGVKVLFAYDGAFFQSWHVDAGRELLVDGAAVTQLITEAKLLRFVSEGNAISEVTPTVKHSRAELISTFRWVNNLLRKEGLMEGMERFTEFANFLFLKLISELEEERKRRGEPRVLPDEYCWTAFAGMDAAKMKEYVNGVVLPYLVKKYNHSGDVFESELKVTKPATIAQIVERLSSIRLSDADTDVKGDAFEYFLKESITVGNDLGEYFTPRHLVNLMIELIEPKFGERVYDPTCGTGGFLIAVFRYIQRRVARNAANDRILREETVFGRELTSIASVAKMNMILTGDGHTNITRTDSLEHPVEGVYDVVLANPPYGQDTDYGGLYPVPSNNGDAVFIQHIFKSLKEGGRAAVVIPEGVLFSREMMAVRQFLLKSTRLVGVVSLPQGVFRPYADSKTNIVVFERNPRGSESVWFYDLQADGFDANSDLRLPIPENDIPDLLARWNQKETSARSWTASIREIEENGWDLLVPTYDPRRPKQQEGFVPFETFLKPVHRPFEAKPGEDYREIKVRWYGNGATQRKRTRPGTLGSRLSLAKAGDVIISRIDARRGAIAVVPRELDGAVVTHDFPLFEVDTKKIDPRYLDYCLRYGDYARFFQRLSKGTSRRRRIGPQDILKLTIYVPSPDEQRSVVEKFDRLTTTIHEAEKEITSLKAGMVARAGVDYSVESVRSRTPAPGPIRQQRLPHPP